MDRNRDWIIRGAGDGNRTCESKLGMLLPYRLATPANPSQNTLLQSVKRYQYTEKPVKSNDDSRTFFIALFMGNCWGSQRFNSEAISLRHRFDKWSCCNPDKFPL